MKWHSTGHSWSNPGVPATSSHLSSFLLEFFLLSSAYSSLIPSAVKQWFCHSSLSQLWVLSYHRRSAAKAHFPHSSYFFIPTPEQGQSSLVLPTPTLLFLCILDLFVNIFGYSTPASIPTSNLSIDFSGWHTGTHCFLGAFHTAQIYIACEVFSKCKSQHLVFHLKPSHDLHSSEPAPFFVLQISFY